MNLLLRLFLTTSSISYFVIIFLIYNEIYPCKTQLGDYWYIIVVVYLLIPVLATLLSLLTCKFFSNDSLKEVKSIETSNNDFLANYLAFFFVALSIDDESMVLFWVVLGLTIVFTFVSRVSYFNPMFLIFGYNFYYVHTAEDVKVMLISRHKLKSPSECNALTVRRINDYTFIEI